jgi:DNA-binding NtrC family response regulator
VALGYRTSVAESAEQALRLIDSHSIDITMLDLKLPGAGGVEVLRQIKSRRPDIEVIVAPATVQCSLQCRQ